MTKLYDTNCLYDKINLTAIDFTPYEIHERNEANNAKNLSVVFVQHLYQTIFL